MMIFCFLCCHVRVGYCLDFYDSGAEPVLLKRFLNRFVKNDIKERLFYRCDSHKYGILKVAYIYGS